MAEIRDLSPEEIRVLGALLEKEMTTPEYYPLTLNGLTAACNQKSNREPVVRYEDTLVEEVMAGLAPKQLVVKGSGGRAPRFSHNLSAMLDLDRAEAAVICLLLLRGPQTAGELNSRSRRMYAFASLDELRRTLDALVGMELVVKLARRPGQKESRYCHLLGGEVEETAEQPEVSRSFGLAAEVEELKTRLAALEQEFAEFRRQFE